MNAQITNSFGNRLRALLKKFRLSQQDIADALDIPRNTVWRWINNKATPESYNLQKLATLLHIPVDNLLNDNNNNNQAWVLSVSIGNIGQEVIDLAKPTSIIMTSSEGGFLQLGGNYELWTDDNSFKKLIADLKRLRSSVIQNGIALGAVKK